MLGTLAAAAGLAYAGAAVAGVLRRDLARSGYPSPEGAESEMAALAAAHPRLIRREPIGESSEGRPLHAFWVHAGPAAGACPRLLVTAQIHAVEFVGSYVARSVARRLVEGYGSAAHVTQLLDGAAVCFVPLLNPDGAARVWRRGGYVSLAGARATARGVDPNRNFPAAPASGGRRAWNTARRRPGSAYYRGPHPLSEPECLALARLAARERFCAAVNFHSFGGVVYLPEDASAQARAALAVFEEAFPSQQPRLRYSPVPERSAAIVGQLDPFLLEAFGTPSVTIEVSRPGLELLLPWRLTQLFAWANPSRPERWAENDARATIHALCELLRRTGGATGPARRPELADGITAPAR